MKIISVSKDQNFIKFNQLSLIFPSGEKLRMPGCSILAHLLCHFRIFVRLLRLEPRCAAFISDDVVVFSFRRKLWYVSIKDARIIKTENLRCGFSDVLSFCSTEGNVYYGDYGQNPTGKEINIYRITESLSSEVCYTFPSGAIKHVHNIIFDRYRERYFIFTGDFGEKIGIYETNKDFSEVKPFLLGQQCYRAVVGKVLKKGLLYATDAVMEENNIIYIPFESKMPRQIKSLNGSVIYGIETEKGLLLSTTVEPYPSTKSRIVSLLSNHRGLGIKSDAVDVVYVDESFEANVMATYRKDVLPMRLFQYGAVMFPAYCRKPQSDVYINPISVKKYDGKIVRLSIL